MEESTAVDFPKDVGLINPAQTIAWAEVFRKSGLFSSESGDVNVQIAQAQVKMLAGYEMGLQPFFSMQNLYVVKGHIFISASAYAALANSGDSMMITTESTSEKAVIEFYRRVGSEFKLVHTQTYSWDDVPANRKILATYQADRADMIWNRCMTKGGHKSLAYKVGGLKTIEEAADDEGFVETQELIPHEDAVQIGGPSTGDVATITEQLASAVAESEETAPPVEVKKTRGRPAGSRNKPKDNEPEAIIPPAEQPDEQVSPDLEIPIGEAGPPSEASGAEMPDDDGTPISPDDAQIASHWILTEKFPAQVVLQENGWHLSNVGQLTQYQFEVMKPKRIEWLRKMSKQFGWPAEQDLSLLIGGEQVKQLQADYEKRTGKPA